MEVTSNSNTDEGVSYTQEELQQIFTDIENENEQSNKPCIRRIYEWLYGSGGLRTMELRIMSCYCGPCYCCNVTEKDRGMRGCIWFLFGDKRYFCQGL